MAKLKSSSSMPVLGGRSMVTSGDKPSGKAIKSAGGQNMTNLTLKRKRASG